MQKTRKATRIWSLLLAFCLVLTLLPAGVLTASAEGTYYVAGDSGLCGSNWSPTDAANLMSLDSVTIYKKTYSSVAVGTYSFKVTDGSNWWGDNGNNYTIVVSSPCDVTITFDADTKTIGVEGDSVSKQTELDINAVRVVGNGTGNWLHGVSWDPANDANKMSEKTSGVYEITYENVEAGSYVFKFAANGSWTHSWGSSGTEGVAAYNGSDISLSLVSASDVTLKLDLTNYIHSTKQGATYSVTVTPVSGEPAKDYYLFGSINGVDYGSGTDYENLGVYKFVDGKLTAEFNATSYVAVKTTGNADWYMTDGWQGEVTSVTLYNTKTLGTDANKLMVPGNVEVTFTLVENEDGTLTLSYAPVVPEGYTAVRIHFLKPDDWGSLNAYLWNGSYAVPGYDAYHTWPGSGEGIHANATHAGWYDFTVALETPTAFNFIFNSGSNQTENLYTDAVTGNTELWVVGDKVYTEAPGEWSGVYTYTANIHFQKPADWGETVNAWIWDKSNQSIAGYEQYHTDWPGAPIEADTVNAGWYNVSVTVGEEDRSGFNFLLNDGSKQTGNLSTGTLQVQTDLWVVNGAVQASAPAGWVDPTRTIHVPGTFPGPSWDAASNQMTYDADLGLYVYTFEDVPPANYEFKIAVNGTWSENYGLGGIKGGANIPVAVPRTMDVTVYYNDETHNAVTSVDYVFADITLSGGGLAETKLTDRGLTGIYSATVTLAAGTYEGLKLTYGGKDYPFAPLTLRDETAVTFYMDPATGVYYHNGAAAPETTHIRFDTKDASYKSLYGAVPTDTDVTFAIETGTDATAVSLIVKTNPAVNLPMEKSGAPVNGVQRWTLTTRFDSIGEYDYYFVISNGASVVIYGDDDGYYGTGKTCDLGSVLPYDLIVYKKGYETPDWMKDAVIYQIYPDRFFNGDSSNDHAQTSARGAVNYEFPENWYTLPENPEQEALLDEAAYKATGAYWGDGEWSNEIYCGDLAGIIEKIDYLKALGVNVIYLNPVFSSISSHRYDACDYMEIDPILGDLGDFTELVKVAEANGMHIILDGVFNHVSDDSVYFDRYYKFLGQSEKIGAYPYWAYVYDYMAENDVDQTAAEAAAKTYFCLEYGITDYSYTEWFDIYSTQLKDSDGIPAVDTIGQRAGKPVYGYDGWWGYDSMPVIKSTNGSEYQTGNWAEEIIYNEDGTSVTQYWLSQGSNGWRLDVANEVSDETWQKFRESVKALDSDAVIIGEIWDDASKYLMGDMYDSVMNYQFRNAVTSFAMGTADSMETTKAMEKLRERYPEEAFYAMMNLVGSHDTARILSYLDGIGDDRSDKSIEAAFPTYEATSQTAKDRQYLVAFTQFTYAGAPTIYYGDEIGMVGADDPDDRRAFEWGKGNQDILTWYATLAAIRAEYPALRTGSVEPFEVNDSILAYVRRDSSNALIVLGSNDGNAQTVTIHPADLGVTAAKLTDLISGKEYPVTGNGVAVEVKAFRGVILVDSDEVKTVTVNQEALKPAYDSAYIVPEYEYFTITAAAGENGWIVPEGARLVRTGESVTYTIVAARGYEVADVRVDGRSVGAVTSYTFENIQADHTITASFRVRVLDLVIVSGIGSGTSITKPTEPMNFTDVSTADSFYNAVKYVYEEGLMNGTGDNKFSPYDTLNRAMVVTILYRIEGEPATRYNGMFTDVADYQWYTNAVEWAAKNEIVNGYGDGKFGPKDPVTREQLAAILYRYAQSKGYDVTAAADLSGYADGANVSSYAVSAVKWAVAKNILAANQGKLQPRDAANRAQVAISMAGFHQQYVK